MRKKHDYYLPKASFCVNIFEFRFVFYIFVLGNSLPLYKNSLCAGFAGEHDVSFAFVTIVFLRI